MYLLYIYLLQKDMDVNSRDPLQNIIPFRIKGVEIGRFDSSGNLKIGTTTTTAPTVRLDISGGEARVNSGSAASTAITTTGRIGVNTAAPTVALDVSGAARLTASSATATALTTTGRIGVNTTTPLAAALDVSGGAYFNSGTGSGTVALWTLGRVGVNNTAPQFDLDVNGRACVTASSATATALTTTGRIGVNTAAPGADLDVSGAARVTASSATSTALTTVGRIGVNTATPTVDLDVSGVARMYASSATATALTTTGRIGVNTAAPTVDLDVVGAVRVSASSATSTALTTTGRIGVNTATPTVDLEVNGLAKIGNVTIGANPLYAFTSHTFDNANATGRLGPSLTECRSRYQTSAPTATWAQDTTNTYLNMTNNGIQLWTVPVTGNYTIRAVGAGGGGSFITSNGRGINIQLTTTLIKGEVIRILVGQKGTYGDSYVVSPAYNQGTGGGGTFVVRGTQTPIIVAGGGGGTGYANRNFVNNNANLGTSGFNSDQANGGTNGQGGVGSSDGGGGGMFGGGGGNGSEGGLSFINGGSGGIGDTGSSINGGFGGGGGGNSYDGGGGGGGYSGGGGGGGGWDSRGGGGGGSFGIETLTDNGTNNTEHGSVTITLISTSSDFDVSGVSRMYASSATATALTTTGRIGVNMTTPTVDLDVSGNARVTGSMTINSCTPRSSVTYTGTVLRTNYSIPVALIGGNFITNKVYFSIRVQAGPRSLFLKPNGSASPFHSFIQQTGGGTVALSGFDDTAGFRMCEIMEPKTVNQYTVPTFTHIVGEFTIIRNTVGNTSSISSGIGITTRIYGTLVQYGNHYMQKGDFQGQAVQGYSDDSYDRIDLFQFLTSDATKDADSNNSVAVTIEG